MGKKLPSVCVQRVKIFVCVSGNQLGSLTLPLSFLGVDGDHEGSPPRFVRDGRLAGWEFLRH